MSKSVEMKEILESLPCCDALEEVHVSVLPTSVTPFSFFQRYQTSDNKRDSTLW